MKVEQISIFVENKPGTLEHVARILKEASINIRTLSIADTSDFGIVRLIVNDVADFEVFDFCKGDYVTWNNTGGSGQVMP